MQPIQVYGTSWCHDTTSTRQHLAELNVPYQFIDIDQDPEGEEWVKSHNAGKRKMPTLDISGQVLSVPSTEELDEALRAKGVVH